MRFSSRLQKELEDSLGLKLELKINDNRSTMLSVRWEPDRTKVKVSLHRMFLEAPPNVMQSLACYIKEEDRIIAPNVKSFIEDNVKKLDYSHLVNRKKLYSQGSVYNLQQMYNDLNREYFDNKMQLLITWFGKPNQRGKTRVTFGLYHDPLKLIKINRLLDSPAFPDYLVAYVIYHEMLHNVCPSYCDEKGIHHIHSKEFKQLEQNYRHYNLAQQWINENKGLLFSSNYL